MHQSEAISGQAYSPTDAILYWAARLSDLAQAVAHSVLQAVTVDFVSREPAVDVSIKDIVALAGRWSQVTGT